MIKLILAGAVIVELIFIYALCRRSGMNDY